MHPTFTSAVANTRLHGELVLYFTTLLSSVGCASFTSECKAYGYRAKVALYFTVRSQRTNKSG